MKIIERKYSMRMKNRKRVEWMKTVRWMRRQIKNEKDSKRQPAMRAKHFVCDYMREIMAILLLAEMG